MKDSIAKYWAEPQLRSTTVIQKQSGPGSTPATTAWLLDHDKLYDSAISQPTTGELVREQQALAVSRGWSAKVSPSPTYSSKRLVPNYMAAVIRQGM